MPLQILDLCRVGRAVALAASTSLDVWVFEEQGASGVLGPPQYFLPPGSSVRYGAQRFGETIFFRAEQPAVNSSLESWQRFCNTKQSGFSKGAFAIFVATGPYEFSWLVEDDVVFTGPWRNFFEAPAIMSMVNSGVSAVVYTSRPRGHHWPWGVKCVYAGEPCPDVYRRLTQQNLWPIGWFFIGVSRRFAGSIVAELDSGRPLGHHEATTNLFCKLDADCSIRQIPASFRTNRGFYFTSGSWRKSTLTFAEALRRDGLKERRPDYLWHPVKCEADPDIGREALAWATNVSTGGRGPRRVVDRSLV